jgi:hypothetical protein
MYIPVDDATEGGTPILNRSGLKMAPPPKPKAPDTHPPRKANITNFITTDLTNLISLLDIPLLYLTLSLYSWFAVLIPTNVTQKQIPMYIACTNQSRNWHLVIPTIDGEFEFPLSKPTSIYAIKTEKHRPCFFHYQ